MKAWLFQDPRQLTKQGAKCPWSVGWYEAEGKRRSKRVGGKSMAEKFRLKKQTELEHGIASARSVSWKEFRNQYDETVLSMMSPGHMKETTMALQHFERLIKPKKIEAVTAQVVDLYKTRRSKERGLKKGSTVSVATVNKELRHLRSVFNKAEEWGSLNRAPKIRMLREPERDPAFVDDKTFADLYAACDSMTLPKEAHYTPGEWWKALLTFAYLTGWRVGEILALRKEDVDFEQQTAFLSAENTKGRRDITISLHPVVIDHLRTIVSFSPVVFSWPYNQRSLWTQFAKLKKEAEVEFPGAFHRLRFGFANANVDRVPADVLQQLMRHQAASTTQGYINKVRRLRTQGTAEQLHVPDVLRHAN